MKKTPKKIVIILALIIVTTLTVIVLKPNKNETERKRIEEISKEVGPLQIESEYLGPNNPNNPIMQVD